MIAIVILCFISGIFLSAFFSGNETGFYRVTRLRLVMDGLKGDKVAKRLLWLTNNPSLFVATTLIGNNIANYLTSLAIVLGSRLAVGRPSLIVDILAPIALAPILFIYGESLPKRLFLKMPNYLLRKSGLLFMFFFGLLLPISSLLWTVGRMMEKLMGQSPVKVRLALARQELDEILQEGHDNGILQKGQRDLANSMFSCVNRPIREFVKPSARFLIKQVDPTPTQLKEFARRQKVGIVVYNDAAGASHYVKIIDLLIAESGTDSSTSSLIDVSDKEIHGSVLVKMQSGKQPIARVVDQQNKIVGFVTINDLSSGLFSR